MNVIFPIDIWKPTYSRSSSDRLASFSTGEAMIYLCPAGNVTDEHIIISMPKILKMYLYFRAHKLQIDMPISRKYDGTTKTYWAFENLMEVESTINLDTFFVLEPKKSWVVPVAFKKKETIEFAARIRKLLAFA